MRPPFMSVCKITFIRTRFKKELVFTLFIYIDNVLDVILIFGICTYRIPTDFMCVRLIENRFVVIQSSQILILRDKTEVNAFDSLQLHHRSAYPMLLYLTSAHTKLYVLFIFCGRSQGVTSVLLTLCNLYFFIRCYDLQLSN